MKLSYDELQRQRKLFEAGNSQGGSAQQGQAAPGGQPNSLTVGFGQQSQLPSGQQSPFNLGFSVGGNGLSIQGGGPAQQGAPQQQGFLASIPPGRGQWEPLDKEPWTINYAKGTPSQSGGSGSSDRAMMDTRKHTTNDGINNYALSKNVINPIIKGAGKIVKDVASAFGGPNQGAAAQDQGTTQAAPGNAKRIKQGKQPTTAEDPQQGAAAQGQKNKDLPAKPNIARSAFGKVAGQVAAGVAGAAAGVAGAAAKATVKAPGGTWLDGQGTPRTDLGTTKTDLGTTKTDLGVTKTDLGVTKTDLGATKTDLGVTKTDLGTTKTEATGAAAPTQGTARPLTPQQQQREQKRLQAEQDRWRKNTEDNYTRRIKGQRRYGYGEEGDILGEDVKNAAGKKLDHEAVQSLIGKAAKLTADDLKLDPNNPEHQLIKQRAGKELGKLQADLRSAMRNGDKKAANRAIHDIRRLAASTNKYAREQSRKNQQQTGQRQQKLQNYVTNTDKQIGQLQQQAEAAAQAGDQETADELAGRISTLEGAKARSARELSYIQEHGRALNASQRRALNANPNAALKPPYGTKPKKDQTSQGTGRTGTANDGATAPDAAQGDNRFGNRLNDYEKHQEEIAKNMDNSAFKSATKSIDQGQDISKEDMKNLSDRQKLLLKAYRGYKEVTKERAAGAAGATGGAPAGESGQDTARTTSSSDMSPQEAWDIMSKEFGGGDVDPKLFEEAKGVWEESKKPVQADPELVAKMSSQEAQDIIYRRIRGEDVDPQQLAAAKAVRAQESKAQQQLAQGTEDMTPEEAKKLYVQGIRHRTGSQDADGNVPEAVDEERLKQAEQILRARGDLRDSNLPLAARENIAYRDAAQKKAEETGRPVAYTDSRGQRHIMNPPRDPEAAQDAQARRIAKQQGERAALGHRTALRRSRYGYGEPGDALGGVLDAARGKAPNSPEAGRAFGAALTVTSGAMQFNDTDPGEQAIKTQASEKLEQLQGRLRSALQSGDAQAAGKATVAIRRLIAGTNAHIADRRGKSQQQRDNRTERLQSEISGYSKVLEQTQQQLAQARESGNAERVTELEGRAKRLGTLIAGRRNEATYIQQNSRLLTPAQKKQLQEDPNAELTVPAPPKQQAQPEQSSLSPRERRRQRRQQVTRRLTQETNLTPGQIAAVTLGLPMPAHDGSQRHKPGEMTVLDDDSEAEAQPQPDQDTPEPSPASPSAVDAEDRFDNRINDYETHQSEIDKNREDSRFQGLTNLIDRGHQIPEQDWNDLTDRQKFLLNIYRGHREATTPPGPDAESPGGEAEVDDRFDNRANDYETHQAEIDDNRKDGTFQGMANLIDRGRHIPEQDWNDLPDRQKFLLNIYRGYREIVKDPEMEAEATGRFDSRLGDYETHKDEIGENMQNSVFKRAATSINQGQQMSEKDWSNLSDRQKFLLNIYRGYTEVAKPNQDAANNPTWLDIGRQMAEGTWLDGGQNQPQPNGQTNGRKGPKRGVNKARKAGQAAAKKPAKPQNYLPKSAKAPIKHAPDYKPSKAFKTTADALASNGTIDFAAYESMSDYEKNLLAGWYKKVNPDLFKDK